MITWWTPRAPCPEPERDPTWVCLCDPCLVLLTRDLSPNLLSWSHCFKTSHPIHVCASERRVAFEGWCHPTCSLPEVGGTKWRSQKESRWMEVSYMPTFNIVVKGWTRAHNHFRTVCGGHLHTQRWVTLGNVGADGKPGAGKLSC